MYAFIATALIAAVLAGAGTWRVQDWRYAAKEKERIEAQAERERNDRKAIDVASTGHEKDKAQIRTEFITITERITDVVKEPFYVAGELCFDDAGMRELAAATGAQPAASQPAGALRGPGPAK